MKAIILAGGMGTRLQPLTQELPKPMIDVLNRPLLEYSIKLLKTHGIDKIGVTLMFLPQIIKNYFKSGEDCGVDIHYFEETSPRGTAGSVKAAEEFLDEDFVVLSGDALTNVDLSKIILFHNAKGADVTIVLSKQPSPLEYGVVQIDTSCKVISFLEKPNWENVVTNTVNTGIYIIKKSILDKIPANVSFDFSRDLFPALLAENAKIYGYITEDYWCDLGNPCSYLQANADILNGKVFFNKYENILEENVQISEAVKLIPPVYIGKNTIIKGACTIGPCVTIGENCIIDNANISSSVIWKNSVLTACEFKNSVLGEKSKINGAVLGGNNVIGSNVIVENGCLVKNGCVIYNNICLNEHSIVDGIIKNWTQKKKTLWDNGTICGIWDNEICSEHLMGIASSFKAKEILIATSKTPLGSAIGTLLASFYTLCGTNVYLAQTNEYSCRFFSSVNKKRAVYINETDKKLSIDLIEDNGLNIPSVLESKIDFNSRDFSGHSGKIIKLKSLNKDFEYFLNSAIPFSKGYVEIYSKNKIMLHNLVWKENDFEGASSSAGCLASVKAKNGTVTDVYTKDGRISTFEFMRLKIAITELLGGKEVFLPIYAPEEAVELAQKSGLKVLNTLQHKGNSMQQANSFNSVSVLLEYVPEFFAQALSLYLSTKDFEKGNILYASYNFSCPSEKACNLIYALNKNHSKIITANYRDSHITIVPKNNGYSFTAYGKFFKEEYAPDQVVEFVNDTINTLK